MVCKKYVVISQNKRQTFYYFSKYMGLFLRLVFFLFLGKYIFIQTLVVQEFFLLGLRKNNFCLNCFHMSHVIIFFNIIYDGTSWWRVCYEPVIPRLVVGQNGEASLRRVCY